MNTPTETKQGSATGWPISMRIKPPTDEPARTETGKAQWERPDNWHPRESPTGRQAAHSPLPWYADLNDFTLLSDKVNTYGNFHVAIVARDFLEAASEADKAQAQANLKLIVASVNHADKLATDLKLAIQVIKECGGYSHTVDELSETLAAYKNEKGARQ